MLAHEHAPVYTWMPVITGFGKRSLDYICCINGQFVAIEAKAPGEWLRPDQRERAREMLKAGGVVFVISRQEGYEAFERWLIKQIPSLASAKRPVWR